MVILLELSFIMDKTKRGIALFITLLVIASILSIIAVSFSYLDKVKTDAGKVSALIQGNLFYKNTIDILKKIFPKGKVDSRKLKLVYNLPLNLSEEKSSFNINLQCKPLLNAIPIAWLDEKFTKQIPQRLDLARDVLSKIMQKYEIKEPNSLEELLLEPMSDDSQYQSRIKPKRGIISKNQFDKILLDYRLRYDDENVFKIPWEKYFVFINVTENAKIDGEYISPELVAIIWDIPLDTVKSEWSINSDMEENEKMTLKKFLEENGNIADFDKKLYSQKAINAMHCEERFFYREKYYSFSFDYSDERNRNFEFNGEI
jgi:hypothetical protein